jgi:hypothetical protein
MKKVLAIACALTMLAGISFAADKPADKKPCCEPTVEAGKKCANKCCQKAAAKGEVCKKCHPDVKKDQK